MTRPLASLQTYYKPNHQAHIDLFKLETKYDSYTRSDQLCALFEANNNNLRFQSFRKNDRKCATLCVAIMLG